MYDELVEDFAKWLGWNQGVGYRGIPQDCVTIILMEVGANKGVATWL